MAGTMKTHNRAWFEAYIKRKNIEDQFIIPTSGIYRFPILSMDLYPGKWWAKNYKTGEVFELEKALELVEKCLEDMSLRGLANVNMSEAELKVIAEGDYYVQDLGGTQSIKTWGRRGSRQGWVKKSAWTSVEEFLPFNQYKIIAPVPRTWDEFKEAANVYNRKS